MHAISELADFELRREIKLGGKRGQEAADELESRIEARKRDKGSDPSLRYAVNGLYAPGSS